MPQHLIPSFTATTSARFRSSRRGLTGLFLLLLGNLLLTSAPAFAGDGMTDYLPKCEYDQTALAITNGIKNSADPSSAHHVCIDMPVKMTRAKVVFNMDAPVLDGKKRPSGLRHMYMLGEVLLHKIKQGQLDPKDVSVIGIMHGGALGWAMKTNGKAEKEFIEKIFALKKQGLNINLEACGVTMLGAKKTNADLYHSPNGVIHVNQGAIGRIIELQQNGYAYYQEGH